MKAKLSFWIVPENELYQELEELINRCAIKLGTPVFAPHMTIMHTVVGEKQAIIDRVEEVAKNLTLFELRVGAVEFSTAYFQCVFARVRASVELMACHLGVKKALSSRESHVFMPHISLARGDLEMSERERIASEIKLSNKMFGARKISIVAAGSVDPKSWDIIKEIQLS